LRTRRERGESFRRFCTSSSTAPSSSPAGTTHKYSEKKEREKTERREKARIARLEAQILKSEDSLTKYNEQLVVEANRSNLAQINDLSKKISQVKQEIEDLYHEYTG
jgi:TolA-binding protein